MQPSSVIFEVADGIATLTLNEERKNDLEQQLALERERQQALIDGRAFAEGVRAFGERRSPVFPGRG